MCQLAVKLASINFRGKMNVRGMKRGNECESEGGQVKREVLRFGWVSINMYDVYGINGRERLDPRY